MLYIKELAVWVHNVLHCFVINYFQLCAVPDLCLLISLSGKTHLYKTHLYTYLYTKSIKKDKYNIYVLVVKQSFGGYIEITLSVCS